MMRRVGHAMFLYATAIAAAVALPAPTLAQAVSLIAPVDPGTAAAEINAIAQAHIAAFNARDAAGATSMQTPDYIGFFHGMPNTIGHAADLAITKQQVADPAMKLVVANEHVDVAQAGDMAVWRCTYRYTYTDAATAQARVELGNYIIGFKRQADGTMKAVWSLVSDTPPAP